MAELLTVGDAARILGVSVDTMRRWDREGRLSALRTQGGQRRYRRDAVNALLGEGTTSTT